MIRIILITFLLSSCVSTHESRVAEQLALAKQATPPHEQGNFWPSELVDLAVLDPSLHFDVRYATRDNFLGFAVYNSRTMMLQKPAAMALRNVVLALKNDGVGVVIFDAYRPWYITRLMWDVTPASQHDFVADPAKGSRHNRGCAVDLSLYDLATGLPLEMPSDYDEFSPRASPSYSGGTVQQRSNRDRLRHAMEAEGFSVYEDEWWHFDFRDWRHYAIQNISNEEIK